MRRFLTLLVASVLLAAALVIAPATPAAAAGCYSQVVTGSKYVYDGPFYDYYLQRNTYVDFFTVAYGDGCRHIRAVTTVQVEDGNTYAATIRATAKVIAYPFSQDDTASATNYAAGASSRVIGTAWTNCTYGYPVDDYNYTDGTVAGSSWFKEPYINGGHVISIVESVAPACF